MILRDILANINVSSLIKFKETNRTINFRTLEVNFEESIGTIKIT